MRTAPTGFPTHALAIEWIRVNFEIEVFPVCIRFNSKRKKGYQFVTISNNYTNYNQEGDFSYPQQATEAGLLYTLQNLL